MRKFLSFVAGTLVGVLVGGAIGTFLAPQSGDETQTAIQTRLQAVIEEGRRAAAERRAELEAQFAEAKRAARSS